MIGYLPNIHSNFELTVFELTVLDLYSCVMHFLLVVEILLLSQCKLKKCVEIEFSFQTVCRKYATGHQLEDIIHNSFDKVVAVLEKEKMPTDPMYITSLLTYNIIFGMTCGKR